MKIALTRTLSDTTTLSGVDVKVCQSVVRQCLVVPRGAQRFAAYLMEGEEKPKALLTFRLAPLCVEVHVHYPCVLDHEHAWRRRPATLPDLVLGRLTAFVQCHAGEPAGAPKIKIRGADYGNVTLRCRDLDPVVCSPWILGRSFFHSQCLKPHCAKREN